MKRLILSTLFLAGFCALMSSCSKSADHTTFSSTPSIIGSIIEDAFTATSVSSNVTKSNDTSFLTIRGWEASSDRTIFIQLIDYKYASGTYPVDSPAVHAYAYYQKGSVKTYGKVGSIVLYNVTPGLVQGTFDFSMKDNSNLNDIQVKGKFTVAPVQ